MPGHQPIIKTVISKYISSRNYDNDNIKLIFAYIYLFNGRILEVD